MLNMFSLQKKMIFYILFNFLFLLITSFSCFAWTIVDDNEAKNLLSRKDIISCDISKLRGGKEPCKGASSGKAVKAQKGWKTRWFFFKEKAYKANQTYELYARLKIEKAYVYPQGDAVDGTVWFGTKSRQGIVDRTIRMSDVPDNDWHIWRIGRFEASPKGQEYMFLNRGRYAKNVWIDKLFLIPVKQSSDERSFVEKTSYFAKDKPGWWLESFKKQTSSQLNLHAKKAVVMDFFLASDNTESTKAKIIATVSYKNGQTEKQEIELKPGRTSLSLGGSGKTVEQISSILDSQNKSTILYTVISSPKPSLLRATKLRQTGENYSSNQAMREAIDFGEFLKDRKKLNNTLNNTWTFRTVPSTLKLHRQRILPKWKNSREPKSININLAQNEYESFQLVIIPLSNNSHDAIKIKFGKNIPLDILCEKIDYVNCTAGAYGKSWKGYYPDPLFPIPFSETIPLNSHYIQPFLITVHATGKVLPGDYSSNITLCDTKGKEKKLNLNIHVRNFSIPKRSSLRSAFWFWGNQKGTYGSLVDWYKVDPAPWNMLAEWYAFFSRYRMTANEFNQDVSRWFVKAYREDDGSFSFDFSDFDRYVSFLLNECHATSFNIGSCNESWKMFIPFKFYDRKTGKLTQINYRFLSKGYNKIFTEYVKAMAKHLKGKSWWKYAYLQLTDEFHGLKRRPHDKLVEILQKAVPDLKILAFGWGNYGISVPVSIQFNKKKANELRKRGQEAWWYVCVSPKPQVKGGKVTNYFIDEMGINHRFHFWQAWEKRIDGFLYWGSNMWQYAHLGNIPSNSDKRWPEREWVANVFPDANGDGYLMYPGKDGKPLASMRLAIMRDGLEDYEYFHMLEQMIKKAKKSNNLKFRKWGKQAQKLQSDLKLTIQKDYDNRDEKMISKYRILIGNMIEKGKN